MSEKKKEFVDALSDALKIDSRSGVESIEYTTNIWFDGVLYEEVIQINFKGGAHKLINVTANSNGANAQAVISAVYGGLLSGLYFMGLRRKSATEIHA